MKRVYGCDLWDGFCDVFNKAVGKPLGHGLEKGLNRVFDCLHDKEGEGRINHVGKVIKATGITTVWNVISGNSLLKKHHLDKMDCDDVLGIRLAGMLLGANLAAPLVRVAMGIPSPSSEAGFLALGMACLGFAMSTLPRNAYVACKAQKEEDMRREAAVAGPQPPQA